MGKQWEWWLAVDEYAVVYRWNKSNRNPDSDIRINLAQVVQSKKTGEMFLQLEVQDGDFAPASPSSLEAMVKFENEVEETIGIVFPRPIHTKMGNALLMLSPCVRTMQ